MKKLLAILCAALTLVNVSAARAQLSPAQLEAQFSAVPWTNGQGKLTAATVYQQLQSIAATLSAMGTWGPNGYSPLLSNGSQFLNGPFDANALSRGLGFEPTSPITVPNLTEVDAIRITGSYVVGVSSGTGVGGQFAGLNFQETLAPSSDHSANIYGVIGAVYNNGTGSAKAIYGRANCANVLADPTYATCIAGVLNVNTGVNQNFVANLQMNAVTNVSGKAVNDAIWISTANTDGSPAAYQYGVLIDQVAIQAGGAAFQARALGPGDFAAFKNQNGSANLFEVNLAGNVGVGTSAGNLGLGENLTVAGFAAFGSLSSTTRGIIGDTGNGNFVIGSQNASPVELRANGAMQAYLTTAGLTVGGTPSAPNGITFGQSSIVRNVTGGNLSLAAGSGGLVQLASAVQFSNVPASVPSGQTGAGYFCGTTIGSVYGPKTSCP